MDATILATRARIQSERRRRAQLATQLGRLGSATETLRGVREALSMIAAAGGDDDDDGGGVVVVGGGGASTAAGGGGGGRRASSLSTTMENLKESVRRAVEGHEELGTWNSRAEEVIRILDKIKVDREGGGGGKDDPGGKKVAAARGNGGKGAVAPREDDEQRRKRTMEEIGIGSHGTKEEVESFLKKIRG
jgi:hypothetical protein